MKRCISTRHAADFPSSFLFEKWPAKQSFAVALTARGPVCILRVPTSQCIPQRDFGMRCQDLTHCQRERTKGISGSSETSSLVTGYLHTLLDWAIDEFASDISLKQPLTLARTLRVLAWQVFEWWAFTQFSISERHLRTGNLSAPSVIEISLFDTTHFSSPF